MECWFPFVAGSANPESRLVVHRMDGASRYDHEVLIGELIRDSDDVCAESVGDPWTVRRQGIPHGGETTVLRCVATTSVGFVGG